MLDEKTKTVAVEWSVEDVKNFRDDLDDDQAWQVLIRAYQNHNAEIGINWDVLEACADDLFPEGGNAS